MSRKTLPMKRLYQFRVFALHKIVGTVRLLLIDRKSLLLRAKSLGITWQNHTLVA